jgi:hypothetical protein
MTVYCFFRLLNEEVLLGQMLGSPQSDNHGQTSANRPKPGPSFQLKKWPCACNKIILLWIKTAQLKVENTAQVEEQFTFDFQVEMFPSFSGPVNGQTREGSRVRFSESQCYKTFLCTADE